MRRKRDPAQRVPAGRVPLGRPPIGEAAPESTFIGFWARSEVVDALKKLEDDIGGDPRARRSAAIRRAIMREAVALDAQKTGVGGHQSYGGAHPIPPSDIDKIMVNSFHLFQWKSIYIR